MTSRDKKPQQVVHPILEEERCPKCHYDYALCNCYDEFDEPFYDRDGNDGSASNG